MYTGGSQDMGKLKLLLLFSAHLCLVAKASADTLNTPASNEHPKNEVQNPAPIAKSPQEEALKNIKDLKNKNDLKGAQTEAVNYLGKYPNDVDVRLLLGLMQLQEKNYSQAEYNLSTVLTKYPQYAEARVGLIHIKINEHKYSEAKTLTQDGLKIDPQNAELLSLDKRIDVLQNHPEEEKSATTTSSKPAPKTEDTVNTEGNSVNEEPAPAKKKQHISYSKKKVYHPHYVVKQDSHLLQAKQYAAQGKYYQELQLLSSLVRSNPHSTEYRLALTDYYLRHHAQLSALSTVNQGLRLEPTNQALLIKKAEIQMALYEFPQASYALHKVLQVNPESKPAKGYIAEIEAINPPYNNGVNEIGFYTDNAYVSDLSSVWDYTTVYYARDTDSARIGGRVNYTNRLGMDAPQFQLDYSPRINSNLYFDFSGAVANNPSLFPDRMVRGEGFWKLTNQFEASLGGQYSKISSTYFSTYTGSLNYYTSNYWFSFRPYYFIPKTNDSSILYTGTIRRYFETLDHFISLSAGSGTSPDIADLLTVNFIVIDNSFVNFNYEFPICNHKFVVDIGGGYQRWKYPSGLLRNLYDGKVGVKYRF